MGVKLHARVNYIENASNFLHACFFSVNFGVDVCGVLVCDHETTEIVRFCHQEVLLTAYILLEVLEKLAYDSRPIHVLFVFQMLA